MKNSPNEKLLEELEQVQKKLEQKRRELARIEALPPDKQLAEYLHLTFCKSGHTSMCGWEHEKGEHEWTERTHIRYLRLAEELLLTGVEPHKILLVLELSKNRLNLN